MFVERCAELFVVWNCLTDELPKSSRVVHLFCMAQLMDKHIVAHFRRHKEQTVVKGERTSFRTTPPPGFLVSNTDSFVGKVIVLIKFLQSLRKHFERLFF